MLASCLTPCGEGRAKTTLVPNGAQNGNLHRWGHDDPDPNKKRKFPFMMPDVDSRKSAEIERMNGRSQREAMRVVEYVRDGRYTE